MQWLAIALGGALGAVLRFGLSSGIYAWLGRGFPYGTLAVNVLGCGLMGFLSIYLVERWVSAEWRAGLLVGVLGALTTFSTFSLETLNLWYQGQSVKMLFNIGLSVIMCLLATGLGILLARQL
ncbi:MAG: fluoride efflux transporter CrcB [Pseudomonadota bacterium]|nr:fluoride efflux transporter CrcB [Pseudomonadota bacterium]